MTSVDQITAPPAFGPSRAMPSIGHAFAGRVMGRTEQQARSKAGPSAVTHALSDRTVTRPTTQ
ncbi:hypothetical protein [Streptomyces sp. NPDC017520]|uniref:hypothetical protein n=1 Tax=Streptomyces sp. NPDC017520 TaxID=3364998 RepID=UPI00378ED7A9